MNTVSDGPHPYHFVHPLNNSERATSSPFRPIHPASVHHHHCQVRKQPIPRHVVPFKATDQAEQKIQVIPHR
jgi:hypothetical protein